MNEITIHGNITADPTPHYTSGGETVANFAVAVNERRFDRDSGQWRQLTPVYHRVVAFRALADNTLDTVAKGTLVTVTGKQVDDSWTGEDGQRRQGMKLVAEDIAVSLRHATAVITKRAGRRPEAPEQPAEAQVQQEPVPATRTRSRAKSAGTVATPAGV